MQAVLIYSTAVFVLGIAVQWLAWRLRLPAVFALELFHLAHRDAISQQLAADARLLVPLTFS